MSRIPPRLPYATPDNLEAVSRPGFTVSQRSRFDDAEREEALQQQLDEAMPADVEAALNALDAFHAEQEEDARREAEEEDARRDERDSR